MLPRVFQTVPLPVPSAAIVTSSIASDLLALDHAPAPSPTFDPFAVKGRDNSTGIHEEGSHESSSDEDTVVPGSRKRKHYSKETFLKFLSLIYNLRDPFTVEQAALACDVNLKTAKNWKRKRERDHEYEPKPTGGPHNRRYDRNALLPLILDYAGIHELCTVQEMRDHLVEVGACESLKHTPSRSTIGEWLYNQLITYKRAGVDPASRNAPATIEARYEYAIWMAGLTPQQQDGLVFVDETGHELWTHRRRGWREKGRTPSAHCPDQRTPRVNEIAASSQVFGGFYLHMGLIPNNTQTFTDFVTAAAHEWNKRMAQRDPKAGEIPEVIFVMDNSSIHSEKRLTAALQTINEQLQAKKKKKDACLQTTKFSIRYLPAYSPFLNPIETVFALQKARIDKLRDRDLPQLLEFNNVVDGTRIQQRLQIVQKWVLESWASITDVQHANLFSHVQHYQPLCLQKKAIETEMNFHVAPHLGTLPQAHQGPSFSNPTPITLPTEFQLDASQAEFLPLLPPPLQSAKETRS